MAVRQREVPLEREALEGKVTYCESLNEKTGSTATGRYRNARYATAYTPNPFSLGRRAPRRAASSRASAAYAAVPSGPAPRAATAYPTFFRYQRVAPSSAHTARVTVSMEMIESAAPSGQLSALPNMDWMMLPIMIPRVPPTSAGVT